MTESARLLEAARSPDSTPFDYIIVGSGAGGGPLAARLALEGRRVLVIEAGVDPATGKSFEDPAKQPVDGCAKGVREIYAVPAYHAASTEDECISWDFSVRHFADASQFRDSKYESESDPASAGQQSDRMGGIFYPRASALGGCTAHHAMVIVRPNDCDWDHIAKLTGDESWRSENMQGYFAKLEECLYYRVYMGFIGKLLGGLLRVVQWLYKQISPRRQLGTVGHGSSGWQKTSFIDPLVVAGIAKTDRTFLSVLWDVVRHALTFREERSRIKRALAWFQIVHFLDPNIRSNDFSTRARRLSLIPIGTDGRCRWGLREHLLAVARKHPDRLILLAGAHVTRVVFEDQTENGAPRAVGVEVAKGTHLYRASPLSSSSKEAGLREQYFARAEVILAGGTFNTPQILMLSGIGDRAHLSKLGIEGPRDRHDKVVAAPISLPGVGANLRDRYEISVISQTKDDFSTLKGVTFRVGQQKDPDPALKQWERDKTGLYTTNGGALAMMVSSEGNREPEPDLFLFGVPAAFRGYYHGWSRDSLRATKGATTDQRNLWSWVILKAYTKNKGTVRLYSPDPFDTPEINFNSFTGQEGKEDLQALCDGVRKVREINENIRAFEQEIWPGASKSLELEERVRDEAWGHHACGTCRIGKDPWRCDPQELEDRDAVLDSEFRVHGVRALRVVDASVFPQIPGYFIVTSVFMVAEKAADTLLSSAGEYPSGLEQAEAAAIHARRNVADAKASAAPAPTRLPQDAVGIALSGGGIRSATFCLGVLQSLAACRKLSHIDFLSTVSGGGYIGAFLGRLYTRPTQAVRKKAAWVEDLLSRDDCRELWWLRRNADYANSAGRVDLEVNLAIIARNLLAVHLVVAALLFGVFGGLRWLADAAPSDLVPGFTVWGIALSFWWWVPLFVLCAVVAPLALAYWLAPSPGRTFTVVPLLVWVLLLASAIYGLGVPGATSWSAVAVGVFLLAWVLQELAKRGSPVERSEACAEASVAGTVAARSTEGVPATLLRNRLTRALGIALLMLVVSLLWVVLDSLAWRAASPKMMPTTGWSMLGFAPALLVVRLLSNRWIQRTPGEQAVDWYATARKAVVNGLGFVLAAILLLFIDALAHLAFNASQALGAWTTITAFAVSIVAGRWLVFLNLSSLQQSYAQKLVRTFLGATNDARVHPKGSNAPLPVGITSPDDDLFFDEYHPELNGGPLHLINVCVNDTVVSESGRQLREDKGLPMCIGPAGVSVGRRYHALWETGEPKIPAAGTVARAYHALRRAIQGRARLTVRPLPVAPDPNAFHVLARSDGDNPRVERLRLGQWLSISGAAVAPGTGRFTNVPQSLFLGIINFRLGYWWDSGIRAGQRPGRYPPGLWRRFKSLARSVFQLQSTLLNEWRGYFAGPAERLWYLSDGGHFDHTGLYELIRRRLPFIIAVDAGDDPEYRFDDLAVLTRQVRLDFGAEFEWLNASATTKVPAWILDFFNRSAVGAPDEIKREGRIRGMLGRITYRADTDRRSWVLLVKANLPPSLPIDVQNYADRHLAFPNESTANQFFSDEQWESYRKLGQCVGATVFR